MTAKETSHEMPAGDYRIPQSSALAHAWKMALAVGVVGLVLAVFGYTLDARRFAFAWLMGLSMVLVMGLGSVFFVLIQHLTGAGWSVTVRRASEFFVAGMVIVPLLVVPVLSFSAHELFPWWNQTAEEGTAHAQEHGAAAAEHGGHAAEGGEAAEAGEHHSPEHMQHEATLSKKLAYFNKTFFYIRALLYLLVWLWLADRLFRYSTMQDKTGDPQWTVKLQRFAPGATFLFAFSLTFAAFDWIMSLLPNWYSTMYGVRYFAVGAVLSLALNILLTLAIRQSGAVRDEINVEHYHDLGKLMFGFLVFWAYVSFSEFFLIWYAAIPEETIYFHMRWDEWSWKWLSVSLVVVKFIIPFYLVISRNAKRNLGLVGLGAAWITMMTFVETYYSIMPNYAPGSGVQFSVAGFITDLGAVLACVGLYLAVVLRRMLNHAVIPMRDPRLQRALQFINA